MGLGTAAAISAGSGILGGLVNRALNERPDIPDLSSEVSGAFARRRRELADLAQRRRRDLEGSLAARGITGSGGASARRAQAQETAGAATDLAAKEADAVARAENRERQLQFRQDRGVFRNRAQAISNIFGRGGSLLAAKYGFEDLEDEDDGSGEGEGTGKTAGLAVG